MNFKIYFLTRVRFIFFRLFYLILRTQLFATFYFYFENCSRSIWPKNRLFYFVFNINLKNKEIRISMIKITIFVQLSLICKSFKCLVLDLEYKWKSEEPNHWKGNSWLHYMSMFGISNIFLYLKNIFGLIITILNFLRILLFNVRTVPFLYLPFS